MLTKFRRKLSEFLYKPEVKRLSTSESMLAYIKNYEREVHECLLSTKSHYEGARQNRLTYDWTTINTTLASALKSNLRILIARSSNLNSNNSVSRSILKTLVNNVIGTGIEVYSAIKDANGEPWDKINNFVDDLWEEYTDNWSVEKDTNYQAYQEVIFREMFIRGTGVTKVVDSPYKTDTLPIRNQVFSSLRLDELKDDPAPTYTEFPDVSRTIFGINLNKFNAHESYWIQGNNTPFSALRMKLHYFKEEAEQTIGLPAMAPTMKYLWGIDQLLADRLVTSRILAKIALFVPDPIANRLNDNIVDEASEWQSGSILSGDKDAKPSVIQANDDISDTIAPLIKLIEQTVGGSHGVSYQTFSRDVEKSNMASARVNTAQDRAEFRRLQERFINCVVKWHRNHFMDAVIKQGYLKKFNVSATAYALNQNNFLSAIYQPNGFDMIDPKNETSAALEAIEKRAGTKQAWFAKFGTTHKKAMIQKKREEELEKRLFGDESNEINKEKEKKEENSPEKKESVEVE